MINEEIVLPSGLKLKNRLVKAAMTEGLADEFQRATPELSTLYKTWAEESGCGMLISGNVQVDKRFLERPRNVVIDLDYGEQDEEQLTALKAYAEAGKHNDTKMIVQLSHGGRQSAPSVAKTAIAPSDIPLNSSRPSCKAVAATEEQIERVVEKFAYAAKVCQDTGFDGVQVHSAHGYLLSSFLNPLANKRTDKYGGSLENRASLLINVVRAVKEATTAPFCIGVKLNSSDFQKGGFTVEEASEVALMLANEGIDFLELSGGNYESPALLTGSVDNAGSGHKLESTKRREAYFLVFAKEIVQKIREENSNLTVMVTGGFRSSAAMNEAIKDGAADLIGIGRPLCIDPSCTQELLEEKIERLPAPEDLYHLPGVLGWSFLQRFQYFNTARMGATQMTLYQNLISMGNKSFDKKKMPNIATTARKMLKYEEEQAKSLKGYKADDIYIQDYLKE